MVKRKSVKKVKPVPVEIIPDGMKWVYKDQLNKGDVIRSTVGNEDHPQYGQYVYAICTGGGFGCNPDSRGDAIFVHSDGFDLNEVMSHKDDQRQKEPIEYDENGNEVTRLFKEPCKREFGYYRNYDTDRWERFWGIHALRPV